MGTFTVTYARVNESEAMHGGTARHGVCDSGLTLRDALREVSNNMPAASESRGAYASDSDARSARWFSVESEEWETGDNVTLAVCFPDNATGASRARLCRFLARVM